MNLPGSERLRGLVVLALRVWLITAILLRVTRLRDAFDPLALVFYTTPWPVIALGLGVMALHHFRLGNRHRVLRYLVLMGGACMVWVALSWRSAPASAKISGVRVVLWNVARAETRFPGIASWLHQQEADLISIAEAESANPRSLARWRAEFPQYETCLSAGNMLCMVRGDLLHSESGELSSGSYYALHRVRVRGRELTVLQADIYARPRKSRRAPLKRLVELARRHSGENLVVLGDFNTPADSAHLDALRAELTNCFEAVGNGIAETWPFPFPVLSLDQIWVSRSVRPLQSTHGWSSLSDHRPVITDLTLR
ncbi:MAG: endonuclease/exonuclease/phosphatase family protein [Verrucomicrobiota bacterium]